jgi:hypothetical protein
MRARSFGVGAPKRNRKAWGPNEFTSLGRELRSRRLEPDFDVIAAAQTVEPGASRLVHLVHVHAITELAPRVVELRQL